MGTRVLHDTEILSRSVTAPLHAAGLGAGLGPGRRTGAEFGRAGAWSGHSLCREVT